MPPSLAEAPIVESWENLMVGAEPPSFARTGGYSCQGGAVEGPGWRPELIRSVRAIAQQNGARFEAAMCAAFAVFLANHTAQDETVFGLVVDDPADRGVWSVAPVRVSISDGATFEHLVRAVEAWLKRCSAKRATAVGRVLGEWPQLTACLRLGDPRNSPFTDNALFETVALVADIPANQEQTSRFVYAGRLFSGAIAARLHARWARLVSQLCAHPTALVCDLDLVSSDELELMFGVWNQQAPASRFDTIFARFRKQAISSPNRLAVADEFGQSLTYARLLGQSTRIARHLAAYGVGPDQRCGVLVDRTTLMAAATLGVLGAGGAYVPIDQTLPADRAGLLLADAGASVLLTDRHTVPNAPLGRWRTLVCEDLLEREPNDARPMIEPAPENLAYVMFTSGSAGSPKGVLVEQRAVTAFVDGVVNKYKLGGRDVFVQFSSVAFDVATFDLFTPLLTGGQLHIASANTRGSAESLRRLLRERAVTVYMGTPGVLRLLDPNDFPALKVLAVGGEAFTSEVAERWRPGRRFANSYGPTETTVAVTAFDCEGELPTSPPIGRAMLNHRAHVLDDRLRPVAIGTPGELYIGGPGLARGYAGMPGATANAFVPDPFSLAGERLYRTGDFVYWRDDGQLVFLGRRDRQVKVRGMRVELGEVEAQLRRTEGVLDVVVDLAEDGPAQGKLVGYVVARAGCALDAIELRAVLAEALPSYMIPSHIVLVEAIPFATTGKVDLSALRARLDESKPQQPPRGELSQVGRKLRDAIITPILGVASIGIDDDLFDLGVDSLQVLQIISAIETVFGMDIPVAAFFDGPSISDLAAVIEGMQASAQP